MKLDIEALAREADCLHVNLTGDRAKAIERLEAFARLIVEHCALTVKKRDTGDCTREDEEVKRCEAAIIELLEDK